MAAPIAVGTRGTIGSLVRKEIEHFKNFNTCPPRFDPRRGNSDEKANSFQQRDRSTSRVSSWFSKANWRKKKRQSKVGGRSGGGGGGGGGGGRFLPSMCSAVEVSEENRIPGYKYRILKSDHEKGFRV